MQLETVKVVSPVSEDNPHGYIVINKTDLTDEHELFEEGEPDPAKMSVAQMRDALTKGGIAFDASAKKADLLALLTAAK